MDYLKFIVSNQKEESISMQRVNQRLDLIIFVPSIFLLTLKPLSHWTATVLRQLATDIARGSQSSLETVASDS